MKADFEYRGYVFSRFGDDFIARPVDTDDGAPEIVAHTLGNLVSYVDELWCATGAPRKQPSWIRAWLKNPKIATLCPDDMLISYRRRMRKIKMAVATALAGAIATSGAFALDRDGDGHITQLDIDHIIHTVMHGSPKITRVFEIAGEMYEMHLEPTPSPDSDWRVVAMRHLHAPEPVVLGKLVE